MTDLETAPRQARGTGVCLIEVGGWEKRRRRFSHPPPPQNASPVADPPDSNRGYRGRGPFNLISMPLYFLNISKMLITRGDKVES